MRTTDCGVAVRLWGADGGRPLLFWHALGTVVSGAWLTELVPALTARGFRIAAVDGPGYGSSPALPPERYAIEHLASLLWRVAGELGFERPVLMGHSWGGVIAVHAAADRPSDTSAVVLLDSGHIDYADVPGSNPDATLEERIDEIRGRMEPIASRDELHRELAGAIRRPVTPELLEAVEHGIRVRDDGGVEPIVSPQTRAAAMNALVRNRPSKSWPVLADAAVPVLLLLASEPEDTRRQNEEAAARLRTVVPHADVRFCEDWGHDLIADGGPALGELVGDWLDRAR